MPNISKFSFEKNGVDLNTLSPNGKFYYKISEPKEVSWAWWGGRIAFYDARNQLIYHRKNVVAAWLFPYEDIIFVKWSVDGNFSLHMEYLRNKVGEYVLIDFVNQKCYRANILANKEFQFLEKIIDRGYDGQTVINELAQFGVLNSELIVENPNSSALEVLFGLFKWYPDAKL